METDFSWLNKSSLVRLLQDKIPSLTYDDIESFELQKNVEKSKNYSSSIVKIVVFFNDKFTKLPKKTTLFTKTAVDDETGKVIKETGVQDKEILMYRSILPEMNKYLEGSDSFSPFAFRSPQFETIILEDLTEIGYQPILGGKQLNFDQAAVVLLKAAKFHAASLVVHRNNPSLIEKAGADCFSSKALLDYFMKFAEFSLDRVSRHLRQWTEIEDHEEFSRAIDDFKEKITSLLERDPDRYRFKTLIHGDLWLSNILFQMRDETKVENVKFVDYQMCKYTSPTIDLNSFLFSSVQVEILEERIDDFLRLYVAELNSSLIRFQIDHCISYEELANDFDRSNIYGLIFGLIVVLPVLENSTDTSLEDRSIESITGSIENNSYFRLKHLPKILKYFQKKGILNPRDEKYVIRS